MHRFVCRPLVVGALVGACNIGCHALLEIDEIVFGDGPVDGGSGGTSAGGSTGGTAGSGGTGGSAAAAGTGGGGGAAGMGGSGGGVLGPWGTPRLVDEVSDTLTDEDDPTFTADGLELFFNSDRNVADDSDIFVSTRNSTSEPWGAPQEVVELNTTADDTNMALAPDGLTMWFGSERSSPDLEIFYTWRSDRDSAWSNPVIVPELNSSSGDLPCAVTDDLLRMIISSSRDGSWSLYETTRASTGDSWSAPTPIAELNTTSLDTAAWMSPNGLYVYFDSERTGGVSDLFRASRTSVSTLFDTPVSEDDLNSAQADTDPWLSPDRRYIMFTRGLSPRQIYEASR